MTTEAGTQAVTGVDAAIQAAKAQAAQAQAAAPSTAVAVAVPGATAVAPAQPRQKMTLAALHTGGLQVDEFLKVNAFGITVGKYNGTLLKDILVDIDMSKVQVCEAIKWGNPAQYAKTYDGVGCNTGGTWAMAIERAQKADPKARPYPSADITAILAQALTVSAQGSNESKAFAVGTKLGHSLSTTNRTNFTDLLDQMARAGIGETETVRVRLGHEYRNKNNQQWGLITFTLVGRTSDQAAAAA